MQTTLRKFQFLFLLLASSGLAWGQTVPLPSNRLKDKPTASVPAGDDWLYLDGGTNGVRKLSPTYFSTGDGTVLFGTGTPGSGIGKEGDTFWATDSRTIFSKISGAWVSEFTIGSGGAGVWGSITGTLGLQLDLINYITSITPTPLIVDAPTTGTVAGVIGHMTQLDVTSGAGTYNLPAGPIDQGMCGVKMIRTSGSNLITINRGGSTDTIGEGGATSSILYYAGETVTPQYKLSSTHWAYISRDVPPASFLATVTPYGPVFGGTATGLPLQGGALGAAGTVLTSNGPGAIATFQTSSGGSLPSQSTHTGQSLITDGSTATWGNPCVYSTLTADVTCSSNTVPVDALSYPVVSGIVYDIDIVIPCGAGAAGVNFGVVSPAGSVYSIRIEGRSAGAATAVYSTKITADAVNNQAFSVGSTTSVVQFTGRFTAGATGVLKFQIQSVTNTQTSSALASVAYERVIRR